VKRILLALVIMLGSMTAHAQATVEEYQAWRNWVDWRAWQTKQAIDAQMKSNIIPMVVIPAEYGSVHDYVDEIIEGEVRQWAVYTGQIGFDIYRPGQWIGGLYWTFNDVRIPGRQIKIFLGDTFTAKFEDGGGTIEFRFRGVPAPAGLMFAVVHGSEKEADGTPLAFVQPTLPPLAIPPLLAALDMPAGTRSIDSSGYAAFNRTWMTQFRWGYGLSGGTGTRNQK
jgi:hypothetical protein